MNILFLCHRIPYPPNKGDKIRSFNEIRYLSKKHNLYLGTILENESDYEYIGHLKNYCKDIFTVCFNKKLRALKNISFKNFSVAHFYDHCLQNYVDKTIKEVKIDAIICFCSTMAEYVFRTPSYKDNTNTNIKLIMDYVDLDSDKWRQYALYTYFPLNIFYKMEHSRLLRYEIEINNAFHHCVFVSQREVDTFRSIYPAARNIRVIPNGVDQTYFAPKERNPSNKAPVLLFTGVMDYFANEDGVCWFCNRILAKIRAEAPEIQFYIVGSRPSKKVRDLARIPGVTVTGFVEDIRKYYWMADVCVIPLRIARGLQNKVLEAMATGNTVVATSNAKNGITCHQDRDIVIADDETTFAKQVISLLRDETRRSELGKEAVENIRKHYSWDENLKAFDELIQ